MRLEFPVDIGRNTSEQRGRGRPGQRAGARCAGTMGLVLLGALIGLAVSDLSTRTEREAPSDLGVISSPPGLPAQGRAPAVRGAERDAPADPAAARYEVAPQPVHQWLVLQAALLLPDSFLKDEVGRFLGDTDPASFLYNLGFDPPAGWEDDPDRPAAGGAWPLPEGAWEEDYMGWNPCDYRFNRHFWDPAQGYDAGLYVGICFTTYDSALQVAQTDRFAQAVSSFPGDPAAAYYWLGRTAHLLADMSVPAHVHLDIHPTDAYETFMKGDSLLAEGNYRLFGHSDAALVDYATLAGYWDDQPGYDPDLSRIFYDTAAYARHFDSDDYDGDSLASGHGQFRQARIALDAGRPVARLEYWNTVLGVFSSYIRDLYLYPAVNPAYGEPDVHLLDNGCEARAYLYGSFYGHINNSSRGIRVCYADGGHEDFFNLDENTGATYVFDEPLACLYQPDLEPRAISRIAALFQLFWDRTHAPEGDVHDDGVVDAVDLAAVINVLAGNLAPWSPPCEHPWMADFDGDGQLTAADSLVQAHYLAGVP